MDKVLSVIRLDQEMTKDFLKLNRKTLNENGLKELREVLNKYTKLKTIEDIKNFKAEFLKIQSYLLIAGRFSFTNIYITISVLEQFFAREAGNIDAINFFEDAYTKTANVMQDLGIIKTVLAENRKPRNRKIEVENSFLASDIVSSEIHKYALAKQNEFLGTIEENQIELKEGNREILLSLLQEYEGKAEYLKPVTQEEKVIMNGIYSLYFADMAKAEEEGRKVAITLNQLYKQLYGSSAKGKESYEELARTIEKLSSVRIVLTYDVKRNGEMRKIERKTYLLPVENFKVDWEQDRLITFLIEPPIMEYARNKGQFRLYNNKPFRKSLKGVKLQTKHFQEYIIKIITADSKALGKTKDGWQKLTFEKLKDNFPKWQTDSNKPRAKKELWKYAEATMKTAKEEGMILDWKFESDNGAYKSIMWKK